MREITKRDELIFQAALAIYLQEMGEGLKDMRENKIQEIPIDELMNESVIDAFMLVNLVLDGKN